MTERRYFEKKMDNFKNLSYSSDKLPSWAKDYVNVVKLSNINKIFRLNVFCATEDYYKAYLIYTANKFIERRKENKKWEKNTIRFKDKSVNE